MQISSRGIYFAKIVQAHGRRVTQVDRLTRIGSATVATPTGAPRRCAPDRPVARRSAISTATASPMRVLGLDAQTVLHLTTTALTRDTAERIATARVRAAPRGVPARTATTSIPSARPRTPQEASAPAYSAAPMRQPVAVWDARRRAGAAHGILAGRARRVLYAARVRRKARRAPRRCARRASRVRRTRSAVRATMQPTGSARGAPPATRARAASALAAAPPAVRTRAVRTCPAAARPTATRRACR
jgi:hypothetical protein